MIRIATIVLIVFLALNSNAQNPFAQVSNKLEKQENFQSSSLSKKTIQLYLKEKQPDAGVRSVLEQIDRLNVLQFATPNARENQKVFDLVNVHYPLTNYSPLQLAQNGTNRKRIYIRENGNTISDLLLVEWSSNFASLVEIKGNIDLEKISVLKDFLKLDGLKSLDDIPNRKHKPAKATTKYPNQTLIGRNTLPLWNPHKAIKSTPGNSAPKEASQRLMANQNSTGIRVYDKQGNKMMEVKNNPVVIVNGFQAGTDCRESLKGINPQCIQSIHVLNSESVLAMNGNKSGIIDIQLKGNCNDPFTICEGILYFGQNGSLKSVALHDDCSPRLLIDCIEKPLQEIERVKPDKVRTIELSSNPRNCDGMHEGEFIILETK